MLYKTGYAILLAALVLGCASSSLTPAQQQWVAARDRQPTTFVVQEAETEAAWARAEQWVAQFAEHPIVSATDTAIQTGQGTEELDASVSITVTRLQQADGRWLFTVITRTQNPLSVNRAVRVARALAYYTASGVPYPG